MDPGPARETDPKLFQSRIRNRYLGPEEIQHCNVQCMKDFGPNLA